MSVAFGEKSARRRAADLAQEFHLPLEDGSDSLAPGDARLIVTLDALELQLSGFRSALSVDFASPRLVHRLRGAGRERLLRACGVTRARQPTVVDATGGLGTDAFVIANAGAEVTVLERHPLVYALLRDAHRRAAGRADLAEAIARMHLVHCDAREWLAQAQGIDVIYLDPMFPPRRKSALVKQPMRMLTQLVVEGGADGADGGEGAEMLFASAIEVDPSRVVIKRPLHSREVSWRRAPSFTVEGRSVRFDVYELH
ncbi:MAG: class I SAM-dependent methyltransferase [Pseudomonadales bacterium]